jgi:hypothetical protein
MMLFITLHVSQDFEEKNYLFSFFLNHQVRTKIISSLRMWILGGNSIKLNILSIFSLRNNSLS